MFSMQILPSKNVIFKISLEDCFLEITFEDQVQKFTDFFEDFILKIIFEDQAQKFTDFFEDHF